MVIICAALVCAMVLGDKLKGMPILITVYYDGKCGLCSREINHYRKISPPGIFNWQDVTESAAELENAGISLADGLKLLHAKDDHQQLHVGVDAFILIWKQLKRWRVLALLVSLPGIKQISHLLYCTFANWRFNRLEHCRLAAGDDS